MIRPSDQFRDQVDRSFRAYVENMDGGSMTCKFCGHLFGKRTSISRIKLLLSGVTGRGVKICKHVPEEVQDAARVAIDGPPEKKLKIVAGSSNNEVTNAISAFAQEQNNEVIAIQGDPLSLEELEDWMANFTVEEIDLLERGGFPERTLINQPAEPGGDSSQPSDPLSLNHRRYYDHLCAPSIHNDVIMNDVADANSECYSPSPYSPSTVDSQVSGSNISIYGQNLMPIHLANFALMNPTPVGGAYRASGNTSEKKPQQPQTLAFSPQTSAPFAISFASINGTTASPGLDVSLLVQNHALLQSSPEATRHGYHFIAATQATLINCWAINYVLAAGFNRLPETLVC